MWLALCSQDQRYGKGGRRQANLLHRRRKRMLTREREKTRQIFLRPSCIPRGFSLRRTLVCLKVCTQLVGRLVAQTESKLIRPAARCWNRGQCVSFSIALFGHVPSPPPLSSIFDYTYIRRQQSFLFRLYVINCANN